MPRLRLRASRTSPAADHDTQSDGTPTEPATAATREDPRRRGRARPRRPAQQPLQLVYSRQLETSELDVELSRSLRELESELTAMLALIRRRRTQTGNTNERNERGYVDQLA